MYNNADISSSIADQILESKKVYPLKSEAVNPNLIFRILYYIYCISYHVFYCFWSDDIYAELLTQSKKQTNKQTNKTKTKTKTKNKSPFHSCWVHVFCSSIGYKAFFNYRNKIFINVIYGISLKICVFCISLQKIAILAISRFVFF